MKRILPLTLALALLGNETGAAILLEGELRGQPVTAETAADLPKVVVTIGRDRYLVDASRSTIAKLGADGRPTEGRPPQDDRRPIGLFSSNSLGGGVMVGEHAGTYQLLKEGERLCAEALTSAWMGIYTRTIATAFELLERADKRIAPKPWGGCSPIRFTDYADKGWPLLAGHKEETIFRTIRIRFDHKLDEPVAALLAPQP